MKKIKAFEPLFFLFFGIFHLHRIWGLIDRVPYADFWMGILMRKDCLYYLLMGFLTILCMWGIKTFFNNLHNNFWWRWIYLWGGAYVLFDLFAIATGLKFWRELLFKMFDVANPYWNLIWGIFILLGGVIFCLGIQLLMNRRKQK